MGLAIMVAGLVVFIGCHVFVTMRPARAALIGRIGEMPYKGAIALLSVFGLILIGYGFARYRATGWIDIWSPPRWTYFITEFLMWPASILVVAPYIRGNIWRVLKHRADAGAPPIPEGGRRNDVIAIAVGTVLYLLLGFLFHPLVVGRPVFGRPAF